jgi:hypothetical protein
MTLSRTENHPDELAEGRKATQTGWHLLRTLFRG